MFLLQCDFMNMCFVILFIKEIQVTCTYNPQILALHDDC